jgi:hypothetical protein
MYGAWDVDKSRGQGMGQTALLDLYDKKRMEHKEISSNVFNDDPVYKLKVQEVLLDTKFAGDGGNE